MRNVQKFALCTHEAPTGVMTRLITFQRCFLVMAVLPIAVLFSAARLARLAAQPHAPGGDRAAHTDHGAARQSPPAGAALAALPAAYDARVVADLITDSQQHGDVRR